MVNRRWLYPLILVLFLIGLLLFFGNRIATFYTDWLWFNELEQQGVFARVYGSRILLFFVFGSLTFLLAYFNVWLTERISPPSAVATPDQRALFPAGDGRLIGRTTQALLSFRTTLDQLLLFGALLLGIGTGLTAQTQWDSFLRFLSPSDFMERDPVFSRDIGFYVFTLPFLRYVQSWLLTILLVLGAGVAVVYIYQEGINHAAGRTEVQPHVRAHLSAFAALALLAQAWGYYLDRFYLLFGNGRFPGAGYTDLHARLPLLHLLILVTAFASLVATINIWRRSLILPAITLVCWLVFFVAGAIGPPLLQRTRVLPNESGRESPFITRALQSTRAAYDLLDVRVEPLIPETSLTLQDVATYSAAFNNIRLWDEPVLQELLPPLQGVRHYYKFSGVDTDRYWMGNTYRQVVTTVREIAPERLDARAQTWPNLHLRYTHGYGVVVAYANSIRTNHMPDFLLKDIPLSGVPGAPELKQPRVYYGLSSTSDWYAITRTRLEEFDYPDDAPPGTVDRTAVYHGKGGIPLDPLSRLAFAARFGTWSILLSQDILKESRILFIRRIPMRVKRLAPFLLLDNNPYPIVVNGKLLWVQDAYTTASTYPYSASVEMGDNLSARQRLNYLRGAVKATVDAYDGTVNFYAVDEDDPLLQSYRRLFPGLIRSASEMPTALRAHLRYPEDLFIAQSQILAEYHVLDPNVYYTRADSWTLTRSNSDHRQSNVRYQQPETARPIYNTCILPGESQAEFVLTLPFSPQMRDNVIGLMVARCDGVRYGEKVLYRLPGLPLQAGPEQFIKQARADNAIRPLLQATNQRGNRVFFGRVRMVPVGRRLLYVLPMYTQADEGEEEKDSALKSLPELRQVIVGLGDRIAMDSSLAGAVRQLARLTPNSDTTELPASSGVAWETALFSLTETALGQYKRAQSALKAGDFAAYGEQSRALGETLRRIKALQDTFPRNPLQPSSVNPKSTP